ncbi:hypothetical protein BDV39DRAFT_198164 [Aspergillus sergii]|uniref:Uncharacterized protein n=1 Tax=Aspergillus sergii TaxID=1034303 RepID=A0A5N6WJP6_9EURO|nr:hypothetical protein BDV39DRAFT_198164 [Aspergillus sergii]
MQDNIAELRRQLEEVTHAREEAEQRLQSTTLFHLLIIPWTEFPNLPEQIWERLECVVDFTLHPLFPSDTQLDYVAMNIQKRPIYSEATLRNFKRDAVDDFVEKIIEALQDDGTLRRQFGIGLSRVL